ncbi:hypothetical protein BD410DRAFT_810858 [Rickenella mellea]|uniref:Eukaryotic translation initiation factor 5B n=1 Tax=Rickenella mellea TaxID=50990 RepID=A0A4R5XEN1_9AGAM|nr:hypothetical protein BD410DRAFT_810858 [Rickenella mellea]
MPPKGKGKKAKKGDDDDEYWAKAGESIPAKIPEPEINDNDYGSSTKGGFSGFASLDIPADDAQDEDFGGLMATLKANSKKKDKKKGKKGFDEEPQSVSFADGPRPGEGSDTEAAAAKGDISASKKPVEVTADDLADEEWGPVKGKDKKKKGKKGKTHEDDIENKLVEGSGVDGAGADGKGDESAAKKPVEVTADDLADEEWGPVKEKGKKTKGKKGKGKVNEDEEPEPPADIQKDEPPQTTEPATKTEETNDQDEEDEPEDAGTKVLSKKEKEKLKKEREKVARAKKKAQAAAKKVATGETEDSPAPAAPASSTPAAPAPAKDEDDEDDGGAAEGGKSDKKKKKKKGKKDEEPAPAPAASGKKKGPGGLGALKALMEEKKRLEEEARRQEEEERKRIEEEERLAEEEARKKEEEKARKKEKEKAKRELAKKEGRLLTKKQKEERAAAEIRKQALLASGVQIEGLQQQGNGGAPQRKVVYSSRKKKAPGGAPKDASKEASPAPEEKPQTPPPQRVEQAEVKATPTNEEVDEWDADSDQGETKDAPSADSPKDEWDASSDEDGQPQATPAAPSNKPAPKKDESESEDESSEEDSSEEEDSEEDSSSEEEMTPAQKLALQKKAEAAARKANAHEEAMAQRSKDNLRSPICCILGHVDTGKTKLLDKIRQTNVQEGEAGGITQQIGATYFPVDAIQKKTAVLNTDGLQEYKIPGLLVIDTPGHESFTNLRTRGSSLCNIAILVVDIMHGLEPQTLESLRLLRDRKTPFIVALNKIDRMYGWEATPDGAFQESLAKQKPAVKREFDDRVQKTILAFAEQGLNAVLYYDNKNFARNVSLVPTSAITGEGVPDMIMLLVNLTQQRMSDRLMYLSELECTVLEVKVIEGLGTTIDVVLSNGYLREGDKIVICGLDGPIVTQVRALLTPQPLRELRIKSTYVHHKEVKAALGVKISAPGLEKAIAGSRLLVVGPDDDEDDLRDEVMSDLTSLLNSIDKSGLGVCVQASTLGSLEALLDFLQSSKIPVSGINIGPVHKKDVRRCERMLEKAKELACILCFDVTVDREAEKLAEELGIRLFKADIIYHLFDAFTAYNAEITEAKRKDAAPQAVWPCRLKTIAAFAKRDPIILGVDILDGSLRIGTPLCVVKDDPATGKKEIIDLGKITSLEINHKAMEIVKKSQAGAGVAVKIEHAVYQSSKMFGRHFDEKDEIFSHITRQSIDVMKTTFKADVSTEEWLLMKGLKTSYPRILLSTTTSNMASGSDSSKSDHEAASPIDQDELQLRNLGYKQTLHRSWHQIESFAASFCSLNFIGGVRSAFFLGILAGGPAALWSSYVITIIFMWITAAVLAEICSALPLSGSIYIWSAESAGPKNARFFGFIVAWWACTAWMTFAAGNCQTTANYIVSQLAVWDIDFPGGISNDNIKWRAFIWALSEGLLVVSIAINYLPPRLYSAVFKFSIAIMMLDFFLCLIWLPIGVSRTYGFRTAKEVFTMTYNGTGAPPGWNWILSFLFTAGTLTGFDAAGHIAEETKNASVVAARGIFSSAIATGVFGFITAILFLFCTPDLDTLFSLGAPQPFVQIYALALGRGGSIFMTIIAVIGLIMNTSIAIVAASRLIFAVARDGVLPLSWWIGRVTSDGQPKNAVTVMFVFGAALLCTILPSQVAFTSLISAGGVPTIAAYGLIALLRLTMTPNHFQSSHFRLGRFAKPFYLSAVLFNGLVFAVMISPFFFPVTAQTFNFAPVIFGAVTIFGVLSWYFTPAEKWLPREKIIQALHTADGDPQPFPEGERESGDVPPVYDSYDVKAK